MPSLDDLKEFDVDGSILSLWVFKKSTPTGSPPVFNGRWIETTDELDVALKATVNSELESIEEVQEYGLLAQNNEGSALTIDSVETHGGLIVAQAAAELPQRKATTLKQIQNSQFFVIKLTMGDVVIYAVSKTDDSWRTKKANNRLSAIFADEQLGLNTKPSFDISRYIDFFIFDDSIFVKSKAHFESVLSYKQAHHADFLELQEEAEFLAVFSDIAPIVEHVGDNKIQLRRACAIKDKGHYKNAQFMENLRARHTEFGLTLIFDGNGRIVPTPETCKDVFVALLDHRLSSAFSARIYDVPNTTLVIV